MRFGGRHAGRRRRMLRALLHLEPREGEFFAWWPRKLDNGTWVWLEPVTRYRRYPRHGGRA